LAALMPALAGAWCINDGLKSTKEYSAREAEYLMLKECPELVKIIFALSQRGLSADVLVEAYDDLVRSYGASFQDSQGIVEGSESDKHAIVSLFQSLINEKSQLAGVTAAMMDEFNVEFFDDLYDRESDAPLAGQGSKSQARHGETIEPEFDDFSTGLNALPASGKRPTVEEAIAALSLPDLTVEEFIETTPTEKRLLDRSEIQSIEILDGLVASQRSTLLVGGTGAGKSVTQAYLLVNLLKRCPSADVFILAQKMDAFAGLNAIGRVTLFNPIDPAESLSIIDRVWNTYNDRRHLPENQRPNLPPVRLLLCDWLSINAALESESKNPEVKESRYLTKLTDIIYNGRELNVCLWIDLQSFNVKAIGMQTDANGRKNFNILGLGNYYVDSNGGVNESYGVLSNMIQSKYMVDDETARSRLARDFARLKPISQPNSRPVMFTTLEPARVALMADLRHYKTMQVVKPSQPAIVQTKSADDPWQEYEIHTKQMSEPTSQEWNPQTLENIGKLIGSVMASSDPRKDDFLRFLSDLQPGKDVSELAADPTFLQIARHRKIISKEGVVI